MDVVWGDISLTIAPGTSHQRNIVMPRITQISRLETVTVEYYKYSSVISPPSLGNARTMWTTMGIEHKKLVQLVFVDRSANGRPRSYAPPVQYTIKTAHELSDNKDHDPVSTPWS